MEQKKNIATIEWTKIKSGAIIIFLAAIFTAIGNTIQTYVKSDLETVSLLKSLEGSLVIFGVAMIGYIISQMPYLKKLSPVFWVGIVGVVMSTQNTGDSFFR